MKTLSLVEIAVKPRVLTVVDAGGETAEAIASLVAMVSKTEPEDQRSQIKA